MRREQLRQHPTTSLGSFARSFAARMEPPEAIGYVNFHAAPDERGMVEIGYTILPAWRRRGYATEAARAALSWAVTDPRVRTLRASVAPDNEASRRLVASLGFVQTGEQWDPEDGLGLVHEVSREAFWPASPARADPGPGPGPRRAASPLSATLVTAWVTSGLPAQRTLALGPAPTLGVQWA